jgi:sporulation protein YlmC with PRC-barrel domain
MRVSELIGFVIFDSGGSKVGAVKNVSLDLERGFVSRLFYTKRSDKGKVEENIPFEKVGAISDKIVLR